MSRLIDVVNEHDTVIYDQSGKHDKSEHGSNIDFLSADKQCDKSTGERKRNRKHNDKRRYQRLELYNHDEVDKNYCEHEHEDKLTHRLVDRLILTGHLDRVSFRYVKLVDFLL